MRKNTQYQAIAGVLVLLVIGWFVFKNSSKKAQAPVDTNNQSQTSNNQDQNTAKPTPTPEAASGTWDGTLKISDNKSKGNLMLVTKDHIIYFHTSRDFSALVGKQVTVSYQGTLTNFMLGNIVGK